MTDPRPRRWGASLAVFCGFLAVSAFFSWPSVRFDPQTLVTRHFDLYPTIWLLESGARSFPHMLSSGSAWPFGESLARVDSYLLLLLAWCNQGLLPGWLLAGLLAWLGPAINAMAAERCAAWAFGVPRPWSLVAGLAYGFSGIAACALLEGHVYQLLAPWLPLLLVAVCRGGRPAAARPWAWGLAVGALWALCLYSTAYLGLVASLLLAGALLAGGRVALRLLPAAALVMVPAAAEYLWLFSSGGGWEGFAAFDDTILATGAASFGSLATWSEARDLGAHSIGAPVGFAVLWCALLAPVVLRGRPGWRMLLLLALVGLALSLGRFLRLDTHGPFIWSPLVLLAWLPGAQHLEFPVRFAWLYALCGGLVASMVLAQLARRLPLCWVLPVLGLVLVENTVGTGMPWRLRQAVATVPSAYAAAPSERAVLDLYGHGLDRSGEELEMWTRNLACYYQAQHGRPVCEVCLGTWSGSPREVLDYWLSTRLLVPGLGGEGEREARDGAYAVGGGNPLPQLSPVSGDELSRRLAALGIGAVALHVDYYRPGDGLALQQALEGLLGAPAAQSEDGGERLLLFTVPGEPAADASEVFMGLLAELR